MVGIAAGVAVAGAAVSLLLVAPAPSYDPWMWLVWGREVASGTLSTAEGPAFKPLPVAICALLAPLGEGAVWAWALLARTAALVAVGLAWVAGRRLAGGSRISGALAAGGVALCGSMPLYAATGNEVPFAVAFLLAAALAWQDGRERIALGWLLACALLRVEAWPLLAVAAVISLRRGRLSAGALAAGGVALPAVWFGPELAGSGDLLRSGSRALVPNPGQPALADFPAAASLEAAATLPLWPLGAAAVAALFATAIRRPPGETTWSPAAWAAAGLGWVVLVALMAQAGFSGEPRYALPGAALISIAGAATLGRAAARMPRPKVGVAALGCLCLIAALTPLAQAVRVRDHQEYQWLLASSLSEAIDAAGGRRAVLACGTPYVGPLRGPLLAHRLAVPKRVVEPDAVPRAPGVVFASRLHRRAPRLPAGRKGFGSIAATGPWTVAADCES